MEFVFQFRQIPPEGPPTYVWVCKEDGSEEGCIEITTLFEAAISEDLIAANLIYYYGSYHDNEKIKYKYKLERATTYMIARDYYQEHWG